MEEKPRHVAAKTDPYTFVAAEKTAVKEKQKLAQLKNELTTSGEKRRGLRESEVLVGAKRTSAGMTGTKANASKDAVIREDRDKLRKREHKSLMKSLNLAQLSTASMGKFDKKVGKNEVDAPKSQKILKKKSSKHLHTLNENKSMEKDRNMKIFNMLEKKRELKSSSKSASY